MAHDVGNTNVNPLRPSAAQACKMSKEPTRALWDTRPSQKPKIR